MMGLLVCIVFSLLVQETQPSLNHCVKDEPYLSVVLFGGTGNLAKKYLWNAILKIRSDEDALKLRIFAVGRTAFAKGNDKLRHVLGSLNCDILGENCEEEKLRLLDDVSYVQMKTENHYEKFCQSLRSHNQCSEFARIFYVAIPPEDYTLILERINRLCRPFAETWMTVLLEKPFGTDFESAKALSSVADRLFPNGELLWVDHYTDKTVVQAIHKFRHVNNEALGPIWNADYISGIEIGHMETEDVTGRLRYFESTGIIRDVIQNHLMELILLVTAKLAPGNQGMVDCEKAKLEVLKSIRNISRDQVLLGQYHHYEEQVAMEFSNQSLHSRTPTFAAVLLSIENLQWKSVPFVVYAGKSMPNRETFVEIKFKQTFYQPGARNRTDMPQIRFQINSDSNSRQIGIHVSDEFRHLLPPEASWGVNDAGFLFEPHTNGNPYENLLRNVFHHSRGNQVLTSERLLEMWRIWDSFLDTETGNLNSYTADDTSNLQFSIQPGKVISAVAEKKENSRKCQAIRFRSQKCISCEVALLIEELADNICEVARHAIYRRGEFHLALSGGATPRMLYENLPNRWRFPWRKTHLWMVDERCVPASDVRSNFRMIVEALVSKIDIPYNNVHPMHVVDDSGDKAYITEIEQSLPELRMDLTILGIGDDGHTASVFPHQQSLFAMEDFVSFSKAPAGDRRMTLTPKLILKSRRIAVLATGSRKKNILKTLVDGNNSLPIAWLTSQHDNVTWYLDSEALN